MVSIGGAEVRWDGARYRRGDTFYYEIIPDFDGFDAHAQSIHGLTEAHLRANGRPSKEVLRDIESFVKRNTREGERALFVGHNAPFDWMYTAWYFAWAGMPNPFGYHALDTKALTMGRHQLSWWASGKDLLVDIYPQLEPPTPEMVHNALADAEFQADILIALLEDDSNGSTSHGSKSEFMSIVSHELRTPLTSIRGGLGLVLGGVVGELSNQSRELLSIASSNTDRLIRLVNDTLDLEQMEGGAVRLQLTAVDVETLARVAEYTVAGMAADAEVQVEVAVPHGLKVRGDFDRLSRALANLIRHGLRASPAGGTVRVSARAADGCVRFEVADSGPPLTGPEGAAVFERFAPGSDPHGAGTGLGLAIARAIVLLHEGRIDVQARGDGSTFFFEVPLD